MPVTMRVRQLVWPALLTFAGLAILIGLGTWQLERLAWKEDLLRKIDARAHASPAPLEATLERARRPEAGQWNSDALEYAHVRATGRFRHDEERHIYYPTPEGPGWLVLTPLYLASEAAHASRSAETCFGRIIVNRGWVPEALKEPPTRAAGQVAGEVEITGLLRKSTTGGAFTPSADRQRNMWYARDVAALYGAMCGAIKDRPLILDADPDPQNPGGWPKGGQTLLSLPNRHLEYALTWFGLAATLLVVSAAFAVTRLREGRS